MIKETSVTSSEMAAIRASNNPEETVYYAFEGTIMAVVPGFESKTLFRLKAVSATRCVPLERGCWGFATREMLLYCDPETGKIIDRWKNPWTHEEVPVVHVGNDPVLGTFFPKIPAKIVNGELLVEMAVAPCKENPLHEDGQFHDFGGRHEDYQSYENFRFVVPDPSKPEINHVFWNRTSSFLPWMKMGSHERADTRLTGGRLHYSATALRLPYEAVAADVRQRLESNLPHFKEAPEWENRGFFWGQTSWDYFKLHFDSYLEGKQFPIKNPSS